MINASIPDGAMLNSPAPILLPPDAFWVSQLCALCNLLLWEGRQRPDHTHRLWAAPASPQEHPRQRATSAAEPTNHFGGQRRSAVQTDAHVCRDWWTQQNQRAPWLQRQRGGSLNLPFSFDLRPAFLRCFTSPPGCFLPLFSLGGSGLCLSADLHLGNTALGFQRHLRACPSSRIN